MRERLKKIGLAALLGLNLVAVGKMSTGNYQKMGNQLVEDSKNAKLAYALGGGSFWQGAGGAAGWLIGGAAGTYIGGPWGGYVGMVLGAGAGAY